LLLLFFWKFIFAVSYYCVFFVRAKMNIITLNEMANLCSFVCTMILFPICLGTYDVYMYFIHRVMGIRCLFFSKWDLNSPKKTNNCHNQEGEGTFSTKLAASKFEVQIPLTTLQSIVKKDLKLKAYKEPQVHGLMKIQKVPKVQKCELLLN
jgi:hypothetical protein